MPLTLAKSQETASITTLESIYERRSVRKYSPRALSKDQVQALLNAAVQAPSAMNGQPWAFLVLERKELLERISEAAKKEILQSAAFSSQLKHGHIPLEEPDFDIFYGAGTVVVVCQKKAEGFCPVGDCYLAAENLMLAAHALGLASCPIGFARDILQKQKFRAELGIPGDYEAVLPIALGYAAEAAPRAPRAQPKLLAWLQ